MICGNLKELDPVFVSFLVSELLVNLEKVGFSPSIFLFIKMALLTGL